MFTLPKEAAQKVERNKAHKEMTRNKEVEVRTVSILDKDCTNAALVLLELRTIFQKQLPKMPKEYVTRLVFDPKHMSMVVVEKKEKKLVGGICFRLFYEESFAEIVFCAVNSDLQVKGYGEFMMNMLKKTIREEMEKEAKKRKEKASPLPIYLLTYADNYAIGYFKKQGFTKEITFTKWKGRIKDYEGGTLMQGKIFAGVEYTNTYGMLLKRRESIQKMMKKTHPEMYTEYSLLPEGVLSSPMDIPGLQEAGFTEEMAKALENKGSLQELLLYLCEELKGHNTAWPFMVPVNPKDVQDYHTVVKHPMDLSTIERKILSGEYVSFDEMDRDVQLIISNCYKYNAPGTQYVKCAKSLNDFYQDKVKLCRETLSRRRQISNAGTPRQ
ncbi:histone acetyltransferase [Nematocida sp. AWRm77]|nr:histone acetyltransferase [Nematocida sp. AWRm77]